MKQLKNTFCLWFTWASHSISNSTITLCPFRLAIWRAVYPSYMFHVTASTKLCMLEMSYTQTSLVRHIYGNGIALGIIYLIHGYCFMALYLAFEHSVALYYSHQNSGHVHDTTATTPHATTTTESRLRLIQWWLCYQKTVRSLQKMDANRFKSGMFLPLHWLL